jgi:hypothetical protein
MGHRANYIIIQNGDWDLFYDHWGAQSVSHDLFHGPELALERIREKDRVEDRELLDDVWCEGGASIDVDRKRLLFFDIG